MSTDAAITALIRHNRARSETKKDAVRAAIARLTEDPRHTINKSLVARHAGVSREFINSHPDLKELINTVAATHAKNGIATAPTRTVDAVTSGLRAQNRTSPTPSRTRNRPSPIYAPPSNSSAISANSTWEPSLPRRSSIQTSTIGCRSTMTDSPPTSGDLKPASTNWNALSTTSVKTSPPRGEPTPQT